jgi:hypothetical protein
LRRGQKEVICFDVSSSLLALSRKQPEFKITFEEHEVKDISFDLNGNSLTLMFTVPEFLIGIDVQMTIWLGDSPVGQRTIQEINELSFFNWPVSVKLVDVSSRTPVRVARFFVFDGPSGYQTSIVDVVPGDSSPTLIIFDQIVPEVVGSMTGPAIGCSLTIGTCEKERTLLISSNNIDQARTFSTSSSNSVRSSTLKALSITDRYNSGKSVWEQKFDVPMDIFQILRIKAHLGAQGIALCRSADLQIHPVFVTQSSIIPILDVTFTSHVFIAMDYSRTSNEDVEFVVVQKCAVQPSVPQWKLLGTTANFQFEMRSYRFNLPSKTCVETSTHMLNFWVPPVATSGQNYQVTAPLGLDVHDGYAYIVVGCGGQYSSKLHSIAIYDTETGERVSTWGSFFCDIPGFSNDMLTVHGAPADMMQPASILPPLQFHLNIRVLGPDQGVVVFNSNKAYWFAPPDW